jgi:hypothetical protein
MTRDEILQRLQTIKDKGSRALRLLESKPLSAAAQAEIQSLARGIKEELKREYDRMLSFYALVHCRRLLNRRTLRD